MNAGTTRRLFLESTGRSGAGLAVGASGFVAGHETAVRAQSAGAGERIAIGVIGCGGMGQRLITRFLRFPEVDFTALCDVDSAHAEQAGQLIAEQRVRTPELCKDFRRVLERRDVDAVVIATPDHWHALPMIHACQAGKDVYVEKPLSHNIVEGQRMVAAAKRYDRVVQVGTWQRSTQQFIDAVEYVRAGHLGRISVCRAWCVKNGGGIGRQQPARPPATLDWDLWLGPAAAVDYTPNRCHNTFRWFFNTASGQIGDNGIHMLDILNLAMNEPEPVSVSAAGGNFVLDDDRDTPDTHCVTFQFKDFVATWETRFGNARPLDAGHAGLALEFIGTNGSLIVHRAPRLQLYAEPDRPRNALPQRSAARDTSSAGRDAHIADFLACLRSRSTPRSNVESSHRSTTLCHLGNLAYRMKRSIQWDAQRQVPIDDAAAMTCPVFQREYRKPWHLPDIAS